MSPQTPRPPAPAPAPDPSANRRFARDVARQLDRRRMRRKLVVWMLLVTALVLAALYLTCGSGFGLGGKGKGKGEGSGPGPAQPLLSTADAGPRRCQLRVAAGGITADGKPATVEEAVAACKDAVAAEVLVTGGAREGDWQDLKAALERTNIQILRVEPRGDGSGNSGGPSSGSSGGPAEPTGGSSGGGGPAEPAGGR